MAFTKGINKIYETIRKQPENKREAIFESFKKDMVSSKGLALKFSLIESVKKYAGKLSEEQAEQFITFLNKKFNKQLNEGYFFAAEEKKLFEKYKVVTTGEDVTSYDRIVSGKELNEAAIKKIVINENKKSIKQYVIEEKSLIKESYKDIRRNKSIPALNRQIAWINALAECLQTDDKVMIKECVNMIKEKSITDFATAVNRTYKLKLLTKKLFKESQNQIMFEDEATDELNAINKKVETGLNAEVNGISDIPLETQFQHLKDVTLEIPKAVGNKLVIEFKVPIYPESFKLADRMVELKRVRAKLLNTKAALLNTFIYQKGINIFTLHATIFDVQLTENIIDSDFKKMNYTLPAKFEIMLTAKQVLPVDEYKKVVSQFLTDFDNYLPEVIPNQLDQAYQQEKFAGQSEGRSTNYSKRDGQDKYYVDKRGGFLDDTYTDDVFSGSAEDSEINSAMDKEFFGDSKKKNRGDDDELDMSDDEFDNMIKNKLKRNK